MRVPRTPVHTCMATLVQRVCTHPRVVTSTTIASELSAFVVLASTGAAHAPPVILGATAR